MEYLIKMVCQECKNTGHTSVTCLAEYENIIKIKTKGECSICLESTRQIQCKTFCGHIFHIKCIKRWLGDHTTCPICRRVLVESKNKGVLNRIIEDIINGYFNDADEFILSYIENEILI